MRQARPIHDRASSFAKAVGGIAAVEFAIVSPLLVMMVALMIDFAYAYYVKLKIVTATNAAAQYAFANGQTVSTLTEPAFIANIALVVQSTVGLKTPPKVSVLFNNRTDNSATNTYYCVSGYQPTVWTSTGGLSTSCGGTVTSGKFVTIMVTSTTASLFQPDPVLGKLVVAADIAIVRVQ